MTVTEHEQASGLLESLCAELTDFAEIFRHESLLQSTTSLTSVVADIEGLARTVEQLQVIGAHAVEQQNIARVGESDQRLQLESIKKPDAVGSPKGTEFRDNADYLRCRLRISRSEARRRIRLGAQILPSILPGGQLSEPLLPQLAVVVAGSRIGSSAATMIGDAIERTRPMASAEDLDAMETHLSLQAVESDMDVLRVVVRRWEDSLDPDGQEPSEEILKVRQGVVLRGKRAGLHFMEISATTQQFEHLMTAMNTATNPRLSGSTKSTADGPGAQGIEQGPEGSSPPVDSPSRTQLLLEGLVGACRIALTTDRLPAVGGHRPQVMVTINQEELVGRLNNADRSISGKTGRAGRGVFAGLLGVRSVRQLACDADIIPVVLGGEGQILDIGRSQRLFPPFMRKGLVARDGGCAFPDCTIPATWCEAHHIRPWESGGSTSTDNGVLLCTRHHHLLHQGDWSITFTNGRPWFVPPRHIDPDQRPRQNRYHQIGRVA